MRLATRFAGAAQKENASNRASPLALGPWKHGALCDCVGHMLVELALGVKELGPEDVVELLCQPWTARLFFF